MTCDPVEVYSRQRKSPVELWPSRGLFLDGEVYSRPRPTVEALGIEVQNSGPRCQAGVLSARRDEPDSHSREALRTGS